MKFNFDLSGLTMTKVSFFEELPEQIVLHATAAQGDKLFSFSFLICDMMVWIQLVDGGGQTSIDLKLTLKRFVSSRQC